MASTEVTVERYAERFERLRRQRAYERAARVGGAAALIEPYVVPAPWIPRQREPERLSDGPDLDDES
jgi:hypothetical protein